MKAERQLLVLAAQFALATAAISSSVDLSGRAPPAAARGGELAAGPAETAAPPLPAPLSFFNSSRSVVILVHSPITAVIAAADAWAWVCLALRLAMSRLSRLGVP